MFGKAPDEIEPYWAVSCLGSTGAGKSFFIRKLLEALGHDRSLPHCIDFSETDTGDIPISVTSNILCYLAGSKLLFDVEGTDGTLPLMQRILMGIGARLRLTRKEKRMQLARRNAVAKFFPPLAFAISNTVIYITRDPLKNASTSEEIKEFASSIAASSTSVRPYLVIVHNLCPINQLRRGKNSEEALVEEFLLAHDDCDWLVETFQGIWCMTFPDFYVVDKRKNIDGEAVFQENLGRLCEMLSQQYNENKCVRRRLHCALPQRSLLAIMPAIVKQINAQEPVSIPDILRTDLKNNPDIDCQVLRRMWKAMWREIHKFPSDGSHVLRGQTLKDTLSLCIGISAHYLAWKLCIQNKAGFPDEWIEDQAASLLDKLMDFFKLVFAKCQATSPHEYDDQAGPVICGEGLLGHDCHKTKTQVIPSRFNWLRRKFSLKLFGGIYDRWKGDFKFDPVLEDVGVWGQTVMQKETVAATHLLRVSTPPHGSASAAPTQSGRSGSTPALGFRQHNAEHLRAWCQVLKAQPKVAKRAEGTHHIGEDASLFCKSSFCCVCFGLVVSPYADLHVCSECIPLCEQKMGIRSQFPRSWSFRPHSEDAVDLQVHAVTDTRNPTTHRVSQGHST